VIEIAPIAFMRGAVERSFVILDEAQKQFRADEMFVTAWINPKRHHGRYRSICPMQAMACSGRDVLSIGGLGFAYFDDTDVVGTPGAAHHPP